MSAAYEIIWNEPGVHLAIYRRAESANFSFDLRGRKIGLRIRRSTGKADRSEAIMVAQSMMRKVLRGEALHSRLVREVVAEYLDQLGGTEQHREAARRVLEDHFVIQLGDRPITTITDEDLRAYVVSRKGDNAKKSQWIDVLRAGKSYRTRRPASHFKIPKAATLNREANHIRKMFQYARTRGYLSRDQVPTIRNARAEIGERPWFGKVEYHLLRDALRIRIIDLDSYNLRAIRSDSNLRAAPINSNLRATRSDTISAPARPGQPWAVDHKYPGRIQQRGWEAKRQRQYRILQSFLMTMIHSGMSPAEAHRLTWADVKDFSFDTGHQGLVLNVGARGKSRKLYVKPAIRCEFDRVARLVVGVPLDVAQQDHGSAKVFPRSFKRSFRTVCRDAGLEHHTMYSCRRSFINYRLLRHMPFDEVAAVSGASIRTIALYHKDILPIIIANREEAAAD